MPTATTPESDLARRLCRCYQRERLAYEATRRGKPARAPLNRPEPDPAARGSVWVRLARSCANRSLDPEPYVRWHFDRALVGRPPEPHQLLGAKPADDFLADTKNARKEVEVAFRVQRQLARARIRLAQRGGRRADDSWAAVLLDERLSLSALFRYALACSIGGERFLRIARVYEAGASRQYRRHPSDYDAVWGRWLPRPFRERSLAIDDPANSERRPR